MSTIAEKLAYVKETKALIKSALIEKGQIVSDTDTFRSYAEKILAIQGGGETVKDIIPEQELTFVYDESNGVYALSGYNLFNLTSMTVGETYNVIWGTEEYSCTALKVEFMGQPMIAIGNPIMAGGENNNMPFAIGYVSIPDDGDSQYVCIIASLDGSASKRVRIYQEVGGGSCDAVVWFVTFIGADGSTLYRMPVLDGDDCKDPITHGDISTPTKESTAQYNYTYSGWSLTEGGSASNSALANVTEDRTVYAAFASTVRKYTITYYDSDGTTVLKTEEKAYGSIIGYIPEKSGYSFVEWQPSVETVTGNASYVAMWQEAVTFARGSWEDIIEIAESGNAADHFSVGDTRTEYLNYEDGSTEEITLTIAAINVDTEKGMTLASNVLAKTYQYYTDSTFIVDWYDKYAGSSLDYIRNYLRITVYNALSESLRNGIKTLTKTTGQITSSDKIFLFSDLELYTKYPLFNDNGTPNQEKRIGYKTDGTACAYWCRNHKQSAGSATKYPYYVKEDGSVGSDKYQTALCGVRFGISI